MKNNSNIFDRIMEIAELNGLKNVSSLAAYLGYSSSEKLNRLKKEGTKPSFDIIEDLSNKFEDLNVRYLITGEGKPLNSPVSVSAVYKKPYEVDIPVHAVAEPMAEYAANRKIVLNPKIITVDHSGSENILYIPIKAAAGYLQGHTDQVYMEKLPSFSLPGLKNKSYRAFEVDGDSMWPTLDNKEMVIGEWVEKLDYVREDRVHILVTKNDGVIIKRLLNRIDKYGYIVAKSDAVNNRQLYPNINILPEDILEIWYAVWHGGATFKSPNDLWKRQNNLEAEVSDILKRLKDAGL